jgi:hypothetical protein
MGNCYAEADRGVQHREPEQKEEDAPQEAVAASEPHDGGASFHTLAMSARAGALGPKCPPKEIITADSR